MYKSDAYDIKQANDHYDLRDLEEIEEQNAFIGTRSGSQALPRSRNTASHIIAKRRKPQAYLFCFETSRYEVYDLQNPQVLPPVPKYYNQWPKSPSFFLKFDKYFLYINPKLTVNGFRSIPTSGVRLDDLSITRVLESGMTAAQLNAAWPAYFDTKGMIRAERKPLGRAAKTWVQYGDRDANRNVIGPGEQGYYYKWYGGIHLSCGKEGLDAGLYRPRKSLKGLQGKAVRKGKREIIKPGFFFKKGYDAVIQRPEDSTDAETMAALRHQDCGSEVSRRFSCYRNS